MALRTDINYVVAAYNGRLHMFQMLFGSREETKAPEKKKVTAAEVKDFVRTHNTLAKAGKIKFTPPPKNGKKK